MIIRGDSLEELKKLEENSVDAVVTDPPYGWRFMGKAWDAPDIQAMTELRMTHKQTLGKDGKERKTPRNAPSEAAGKYDLSLSANKAFEVWTCEWAKEVIRVLKPGGHALIFCGPRTYHRMASGVEDSGFEIRDQLQWLFGSGFPKSHNIGDGRGTALKPANEPIVLARKPLSESTVAKNVLRWGTGALNIDGSRIAASDSDKEKMRVPVGKIDSGNVNMHRSGERTERFEPSAQGRWPANVLFGCDCESEIHADNCAVRMLDEQSGVSKSGLRPPTGKPKYTGSLDEDSNAMRASSTLDTTERGHADSGGASRFFYVAKSSKKDRSSNGAVNNTHPTCKPTLLMQYLIKLITPPGGTVLDPFMGSGSTGVAAKRLGFEFVGIEREEDYCKIAEKRIDYATLEKQDEPEIS